ncbi:replication initiation and membrane attachment family protein [Virgibacillus necropolis]|uniref:Chromosome replication initiation protein n=1 Tax=Virgibacillus necropolis TaxID=163877 RepID=A0A221MBP0_9BACI|nr:DnaD domain protein [Virgibacillus necropolis]ASN05032.1 chromosome replication initiation protein [Virgibacillus necropolis]
MNVIGKVLPVDGYYVSQKKSLPVDYEKSMTHLYQPLIGTESISLFMTLLHEMDVQNSEEPQTHHTLMNYLNMPLDEIYRARLKLEGIGLMKTYERLVSERTVYTYELQAPFSPSEFFRDEMLAQLLYYHLGEEKFDHLKQRYDRKQPLQPGKNITVEFNDVFQTFQPYNTTMNTAYNQQNEPAINPIDFSWIKRMLEQRMIPAKNILTVSNKQLIMQMMKLYELDSHEIEKSMLWALSDENMLHTEEFKNACHDIFKSKYNTTTIKLTDKVRPKEVPTSAPQTQEEQLVQHLEVISPKQLLEDLSSGNHASEQDMRVIRGVMTTQGLPSPVMNVLIHFVLLQSNMKLSKAYLEKIASHWSRANLKTAKEAMVFAKKEKNRYQKSTTPPSPRQSYSKNYSNEVVPDWFKDRNKKKVKDTANKNDGETAEDKERMEAILKKYSTE